MADFDTTTSAGEAHPSLPPSGASAPGRTRPRRWPVVVITLVLLVGAAWFILVRWSVNYYAITPGDAQPVAPFITVPAQFNHPLHGSILLTDVFVTQLNALTYLQERYLSSDAEVIPTAELVGPSTPADQFVAQGYLQMTQAQSFAAAAALTHLGYTVRPQAVGALVYGISSGAPAAGVLKVAQVITAVNATATPTICALDNALYGLAAGTTATLKVEQSTISPSGVFEAGPVVAKTVRLGTPPKGLRDSGCGEPTRAPTAFLGIMPQTQYAWSFPVKVQVRTADIGGPSAGLSMTLAIIDKLSGGHLTGGRTVAATGTIDPQGDVGDVGGVAEKTIAVERAGATVFFVPPQELAAARSKDTPQLHVYAVSTLDQALKILKRLGGTMTDSHLPAQAAP